MAFRILEDGRRRFHSLRVSLGEIQAHPHVRASWEFAEDRPSGLAQLQQIGFPKCGTMEPVTSFPGVLRQPAWVYESLSKPASCQSSGSSVLLLHISVTSVFGVCLGDAGGGRLWSWGLWRRSLELVHHRQVLVCHFR